MFFPFFANYILLVSYQASFNLGAGGFPKVQPEIFFVENAFLVASPLKKKPVSYLISFDGFSERHMKFHINTFVAQIK